MQEQRPLPRLQVSGLKRIDFWYWSSVFIDLYRTCPYRCPYCNTQNQSALNGVDVLHGIPEIREIIGLGFLSDIYGPDQIESAGDLLNRLCLAGYPVNILTKSDAVVHHMPVLKKFAERDQVRVTFTALTLDEALSDKLEGSAPSPASRLQALSTLAGEGIPAGIAVTPVIPCLNDGEEELSSLVLEAKTRGAGWVLFSGFNPVIPFLKNPLWKKTADFFDRPDALHDRERKTKQFLLRLMFRENLPMRVPRINLNPVHPGYSSRLVSEYLFNISYLFELMEHQLEMMRYRRAAYEISSMTSSLKSILARHRLGHIRGVNPEIEKVIEEVLLQGRSSLYEELNRRAASEV